MLTGKGLDYYALKSQIQRQDRIYVEERHQRERILCVQMIKSFWAKTKRALIIAAAVLGFLYIAIAGIATYYQEKLIYWNYGPSMQDSITGSWAVRRYISQSPGTQYAAYELRGKPGMPTVIYMHGRGETFEYMKTYTEKYTEKGWTIIAPEYPGFGGLEGHPSEKSIRILTWKVYEDLVKRGTKPADIIIHGNSLGAGPALIMAQNPHRLLLLSAPVAQLETLMRHFLAYYPGFLLRDKWNNIELAKRKYKAETIIVHAADDAVVPVQQGRDLAYSIYAQYREPERGGHTWPVYVASHIAIWEAGIKADIK